MAQAGSPLFSPGDRLASLERRGGAATLDDALGLLVALLGDRLRAPARDACGRLAARILPHVSPAAQIQAARDVAALNEAPTDLLLAMARAPIAVAAPVLREGRALTAFHLVRIAADAPVAHLRAVAERPDLGEDLTTLLLLRGDRTTLVACLENRGARLSRAALATLADRAAAEPLLRAGLARRGDLPEAIVDRLWPALDDGERASLLMAGFRDGPAGAREVLAEATGGRDGTGLGPVQALGDAAGLSAALALNLLHGTYVRGAVVLARAAGCGDGDLLGLLADRARLPSAPAVNMGAALRAFAGTTAAKAAGVLAPLSQAWPAPGSD